MPNLHFFVKLCFAWYEIMLMFYVSLPGKWSVEEPSEQSLPGDLGLVLKVNYWLKMCFFALR